MTTTLERLAQLMPWVNGDALSVTEQRQRLFQFLQGFSVAGICLPRDVGMWEVDRATPTELDATQHKLQKLFASAFWFARGHDARGTENITWDDVELPMSFPSLRFAAKRIEHDKQWQARYALMVSAGRLRDLVPYLVLQVLTVEKVPVIRCRAPRERDYASRCDRLFIWTKNGRPPEVCPKVPGKRRLCADRVKAEAKKEAERMRREEERRLRAKKAPKSSRRPSR